MGIPIPKNLLKDNGKLEATDEKRRVKEIRAKIFLAVL